jgi:hypothetical protein
MDPKLGFDILKNGTPRTFRDRKDIAYDAARLLKSKNPKELIEVTDRSTGQKSVMLPDGRLGCQTSLASEHIFSTVLLRPVGCPHPRNSGTALRHAWLRAV